MPKRKQGFKIGDIACYLPDPEKQEKGKPEFPQAVEFTVDAVYGRMLVTYPRYPHEIPTAYPAEHCRRLLRSKRFSRLHHEWRCWILECLALRKQVKRLKRRGLIGRMLRQGEK